MAYVQRFKARGSDLATLDYFSKNRLAADIPEIEMQQLVARQVYDLARARGVKAGNLTTQDLEYTYQELLNGTSQPVPSPMGQDVRQGYTPKFDRWGNNYASGGLLPRTAMQMPLESMRPASYFDSGDAIADSAGALTYHLIDSLTLGLIGAAGGLMKRVGLTEENFWSETIGGARNVLGIDFGAGGIKGGDSTAGQWLSRAGEVAGFLAPLIATGGASLAAQVPTKAAQGATRAAVAARAAGKATEAAKLAAAAAKHQKTAEAITKGGGKLAKGLSKMPATMLFEQGHKVLNRLFVGEASKRMVSKTLVDAVGKGTVLGRTMSTARGGKVLKAMEKAAKDAANTGYQAARGTSPKILGAADDVAKEVLHAPEIMNAARSTFQTRFAQNVAKELGLNLNKEAHRKYLARLMENADDVFVDAFKAARTGGLKSMQEKAFAKGAGRLGVEFAKFTEEAANHVTSMLALGLVTRVTHPLSEPKEFGISEDDHWEAAGDIAKYWLKGSGHSVFEGVTGDVFTGLMFATGGGLKLLSPFQKREVKNHFEVMSRMAGGDPGSWKVVMDRVDRELHALYKAAGKAGAEQGGKSGFSGFVKRILGRNKTDFNMLDDVSLNSVAKNYLQFMERNKELLSGPMPFSHADIMLAAKAGSKGASAASAEAREKIVTALSSHFDSMLRAYGQRHAGALLRDFGRFSMITMATSFASSPQLWMEYAKGTGNVHAADLVSHTLFSGLMARQPYYMPGANPYLRAEAKGEPLTPEMMTQKRMMQVKNAMRHLGMRDSALVMEGQEGTAPKNGEALGPLTSDDMVNRAAQRGDGGFKYVANEKDVKNPMVEITEREIRDYIEYLRARHKAGVELDPALLRADDKGEPMFLKGEFSRDALSLDALVQSLGQMKSELISGGHLEAGGVFNYSALAKANRSWYEQAIGRLTHLMTAGEKGKRAGLLRSMDALVGEGKEKGLRYIKLVDSREGVDRGALSETEAMYNELVNIARDLGMTKVEINNQGDRLPRRINVETEKELVDKIADFAVSAEKLFGETLGLSDISLGKGNIHRMMIEGLLEAKIMHSNVFLLEKGVLYDREGNALNAESIKQFLVENGLAIDLGDGRIRTRRLNTAEYEGKGLDRRTDKREIIQNFFRFIENIDGIIVNRGKEGTEISVEALEKFFSSDVDISDARAGMAFKRKGGMEALFQDLGMPMENKFWVGQMADAARKQRFREASLADWRFLDVIRNAGLTRQDKFGQTEVMQPAKGKAGSGEFQADDPLPRNYADLAEALGRRELQSALSPENYAHFLERVERLRKLGLVTGLSASEVVEGQPFEPGAFRAFGKADSAELTALARELTYLENRSPSEALRDLDKSISDLMNLAGSIQSKGSRRSKKRLGPINKLIQALERIRSGNPGQFMVADRLMVDGGVLKVHPGKKGKLFIPSDRKLIQMTKDLDKAFEQDIYRKLVADQSVDRLAAEEAAREIRKNWLSSEEQERPSVSNFMVDTKLATDGAILSRAMDVLDGVRKNSGRVQDMAGTIRKGLENELRKKFAGKTLEDAMEALGQYTDNYLNSLLQETARQMVDVYRWSPGTVFNELHAGDASRPIGTVLDVPNQAGSGSVRSNYLVGERSVAIGSRDLLMKDAARMAYLDVEGTGKTANELADILFKEGMFGRSKDQDLTAHAHEMGPVVLLREARQGGAYIAMEVPRDRLQGIKFIDSLEATLRSLEANDIRSSELQEVVAETKKNIKAMRAEIQKGTGDIAKLGIDRMAWERMFMLKQMESYFGGEAFVEAMNADADPTSRAMQTLIARANLSSNGSVTPLIPDVFNASLPSYLGDPRAVRNDGTRVTPENMLDTMGVTVGTDGKVKGLRVVVYDGASVAEMIGRQMPEMDSGLIMNRNMIEALWHAYGYNALKADGNGKSLAKIRFLDHMNGLLATKDVASTDHFLQDWMEANGIGAVISKDALKQYTGRWKEMLDNAVFEGNGSKDLVQWINEGNTSPGSGSTVEIPLSAIRWTHPIDATPAHASKSAQMTNLKTFEVVDAITASIDAKVDHMVAEFSSLMGDLSAQKHMTMHYLFSKNGAKFNEVEQSKTVNRTASVYMDAGGHLASPSHFGGYDYYLDVLKKKMIDDQLFKIRTDNGSQAVYTADLRRVLNPGEAMLPAHAATKTMTTDSGFVAFKLGSPEAAEKANRATFGWEGEVHFNAPGEAQRRGPDPIGFEQGQQTGAEARTPSDIGHFHLWSGGAKGGIYPGLMAMRGSNRNIPVRYKATDQFGNSFDGAGAETIRTVMRVANEADASAIAAKLNDAWQTAMTSSKTMREVLVDVAKIINGIEQVGSQQYKRRMATEIMKARELAGISLFNGVDNELTRTIWRRGTLENFRAMNGLSAIFGGYDYYQRGQGREQGLGAQAFGLSVMTQRHPSTMPGDTMAKMALGFLDKRDGNQYKGNYEDAELIMKADQDEDHIHFWHDFSKDELGGALRIRGLSAGFTEPEVKPMPKRDFFPSERVGRSYVSEWVDRQNDGKAGIGMISKQISTVSDALHKELAFEYRWGDDTILIAPKALIDSNGALNRDAWGRVMENTQSFMQDAMNELTMKHNEFLDTKAGSAEDPRDANLQEFVAGRFFQAYRKTPGGRYEAIHGGVEGNAHAMDALKAAMGHLYQVTSIGKDAFTAEGARSQRMSDLVQIASRYDAVFGPHVKDHQRTLADAITIGLRDHLPLPARRELRRHTNADRAQQINSIRVITPEQSLSRRTPYDAMSEAILKVDGSIMSNMGTSHLTTAERTAYFKGGEAMKAIAPELKTAQAAHFVADMQRLARRLRALDMRVKQGETMLITEAAAARALLKEGMEYWEKTEGDTDFNSGKRFQPQNNMEYARAVSDTRDGYAIHLAMTYANSMDARPGEAQRRADEAFAIREWHKGEVRKALNKSQRDVRYETDWDTINAVLNEKVRRYMEKFGGEGNETLAALELLRPQAFGYFIDKNGVEMVRYRRFPQAVLGSILRTMNPMSITATGHTSEWGAATTSNLMQLLARSASTADMVLSGDPAGIHNLNKMIEAIESGGRSVTSAIQFKELDPYRQKKVKTNMQAAAIDNAFGQIAASIEGSQFAGPREDLFGFGTGRSADFFLNAAVTDARPALRARVLQRQTHDKMGIPAEMITFLPDTETATISIYEQRDNSVGPLEMAVKAGERRKIAEGLKKGEKITPEVREQRVRQRESKFLEMMLKSLDARSDLRSETSSVDVMGEDLIDIQRRLKFEKGECQ